MAWMSKVLASVILISYFGPYSPSLAQTTPDREQVLGGILQSLGRNVEVIDFEFEAYPSSEFEGRVNVRGTYSLYQDYFSNSRESSRVYERLISEHGIEKATVREYLKERGGIKNLREVTITYTSGTPLRFDGDLRYKAIVGGFEVLPNPLRRETPVGSSSVPRDSFVAGSFEEDAIIAEVVEWTRKRGRVVDLSMTKSERETIVERGIRHDEFVTVMIPQRRCTVDWWLTDAWKSVNGERTWLGDGRYLEKVEGGAGLIRKYAVLPEVQDGMIADGLLLDIEFSSPCEQ
jgi:hypothetical protein